MKLPKAMLLVLLELPNIGIPIFVVVDAFNGFPSMELACEELAIRKEVGPLPMKQVVTPLTKIDIAVGILVYPISVLLFVNGLAHIVGVVEILEGYDALPEAAAAVREIAVNEFLDEVFPVRGDHPQYSIRGKYRIK